MAAVESLGSCTMIATDKTGTLTRNELTVTEIALPDGSFLSLQAGEGAESFSIHGAPRNEQADLLLAALLRAAALPNEAELRREKEEIRGVGDTVDVALLVAAHRSGCVHEELRTRYPLLKRIPYEPDLRYSASFHKHEERPNVLVFAKGAPETLIAMSNRMDVGGAIAPIDREALWRQKDEMSAKGLRVLAFAEGEVTPEPEDGYDASHLQNLVFLGLVGMQDPLRPEVRQAIAACRDAGIAVAMVTGDAPGTAAAIARDAGMIFSDNQIVTGDEVRRAEEAGEAALDSLTRSARIYARVEPVQKLAIVLSLARNGHFVAVTGDGVNDAPALKHAHVGVAMGKQGTDVAKESADIIIADDNFASIVRGVMEGRVAYANIRKVIFLLVSTGAAELLLFLLTIPLGMPMPLLPVQLLWLNLVTNGVQHIALAAERPEGDELTYPPRKPQEPIFDRIMIIRNVYSAFVMAGVGFAVFYWLIAQGYTIDSARNLLLLLFVVFENFQALNARSERHSLFYKGIFSSRLLLASVIGAQVIHLIAAHVPLLADTLRIQPPTLPEWGTLVVLGSSLLVVMEFEKWWGEHRRLTPAPARETTLAQGGFSHRYPLALAGLILLVAATAGGLLYWQSAREILNEELATVDLGDRGQIDAAVRTAAAPSPVKASAPVSGTIETVVCNDGDLVETGYVCARIIPLDLQEEVARLRKALVATEAMQSQAEVTLRRARSAYDSAVTRRSSNTARTKARTAIARAETRLSRTETEMKRRAEALREVLEKGTPITAPITGVVHESRLKPGAEAAAGDTIFVIAPHK